MCSTQDGNEPEMTFSSHLGGAGGWWHFALAGMRWLVDGETTVAWLGPGTEM